MKSKKKNKFLKKRSKKTTKSSFINFFLSFCCFFINRIRFIIIKKKNPFTNEPPLEVSLIQQISSIKSKDVF